MYQNIINSQCDIENVYVIRILCKSVLTDCKCRQMEKLSKKIFCLLGEWEKGISNHSRCMTYDSDLLLFFFSFSALIVSEKVFSFTFCKWIHVNGMLGWDLKCCWKLAFNARCHVIFFRSSLGNVHIELKMAVSMSY